MAGDKESHAVAHDGLDGNAVQEGGIRPRADQRIDVAGMHRADQGPDRTLDGAHHDAREGPERAPDGLGQERLARIGEAADTDQSRRAAVDGGDIVLHLTQLRHIGRVSCTERALQYVWTQAVDAPLKKKLY